MQSRQPCSRFTGWSYPPTSTSPPRTLSFDRAEPCSRLIGRATQEPVLEQRRSPQKPNTPQRQILHAHSMPEPSRFCRWTHPLRSNQATPTLNPWTVFSKASFHLLRRWVVPEQWRRCAIIQVMRHEAAASQAWTTHQPLD